MNGSSVSWQHEQLAAAVAGTVIIFSTDSFRRAVISADSWVVTNLLLSEFYLLTRRRLSISYNTRKPKCPCFLNGNNGLDPNLHVLSPTSSHLSHPAALSHHMSRVYCKNLLSIIAKSPLCRETLLLEKSTTSQKKQVGRLHHLEV